MAKQQVKIGNRILTLSVEEGEEGFIEIIDELSDMSLHIRDEDGQLTAIHFLNGQADPINQVDLDNGDVYVD